MFSPALEYIKPPKAPHILHPASSQALLEEEEEEETVVLPCRRPALASHTQLHHPALPQPHTADPPAAEVWLRSPSPHGQPMGWVVSRASAEQAGHPVWQDTQAGLLAPVRGPSLPACILGGIKKSVASRWREVIPAPLLCPKEAPAGALGPVLGSLVPEGQGTAGEGTAKGHRDLLDFAAPGRCRDTSGSCGRGWLPSPEPAGTPPPTLPWPVLTSSCCPQLPSHPPRLLQVPQPRGVHRHHHQGVSPLWRGQRGAVGCHTGPAGPQSPCQLSPATLQPNSCHRLHHLPCIIIQPIREHQQRWGEEVGGVQPCPVSPGAMGTAVPVPYLLGGVSPCSPSPGELHPRAARTAPDPFPRARRSPGSSAPLKSFLSRLGREPSHAGSQPGVRHRAGGVTAAAPRVSVLGGDGSKGHKGEHEHGVSWLWDTCGWPWGRGDPSPRCL
ncbi:uncharacterized protein LOC128900052 isoform X2 [Rissa tridactyla]|uniref:uncharacterized protein LOC128900052 isoform X2 n=1 Tax=Rissa tridactyla TaxID=75485 RepID=UPI0023BAA8B2|nr:uncharacterized protein LOC128900052 isoform X2 [Rissa tridactyla]